MKISVAVTVLLNSAEKMVDGGSVAAVIVVLVLAMATGCIITCTVVAWRRISAKKNIKLR